jgi:hypothetical protein
MDRQPNVAPLWAGATVLGLPKVSLKDAGYRVIFIDLLSAASSGTFQTFVQESVSDPSSSMATSHERTNAGCSISRRVESFTNYNLSGCGGRFGGNPIGNTDLEVQAHAQWRGHRLRYQGYTWNCADGTAVNQRCTREDPVPHPRQENSQRSQVPVDCAGLTRTRKTCQ